MTVTTCNVTVCYRSARAAGQMAQRLHDKWGVRALRFTGGTKSFSFEAGSEQVAYVLSDLRHAFPIGYVQGWSEPKESN